MDNSIPQCKLDETLTSTQENKWTYQEYRMDSYLDNIISNDNLYPDNISTNDNIDMVYFDRDHDQPIQNQSTSQETYPNHLLEDGFIHDNQQIEEISSELPSSSSPSMSSNRTRRSRKLVPSSWNDRFQELIQFRETNDHCLVPHNYPINPKLSQWIRKQRHQRKQKERGVHSTLSDERQEMLTNAGFIWDSHRAQWQERYQSLEVFQMTNGHCNVPSNFHDSSLSNWVKNQRKHFKLFQAGSTTTMNEERVHLLNSLGFNWNPRGL